MVLFPIQDRSLLSRPQRSVEPHFGQRPKPRRAAARPRFAASAPPSVADKTTDNSSSTREAPRVKDWHGDKTCPPVLVRQTNTRYHKFLTEWDKGFFDVEECADGYFVECIEGEIPAELEGTLFRNGPGKFTLGGNRIGHPLDGDGLIASLAFKDGRAFFRSRFVQTPEFIAEAAAEEVLFRGTFATQRAGGALANILDLHVKNTSNTNVITFGDRLLTLFEAGQPYRLDPFTLKTIGLELLDGLLQTGMPFDLGSASNNATFGKIVGAAQTMANPALEGALPPEMLAAGGDAMTAHPHVCPVTGRLVTFGYRVRPVLPSTPTSPPFVTDITFWELDEGDTRPVVTTQYSIPGFAFLHDFAMTENYYVIFQNPVTVDNVPYISGQAPAASCVRWVAGKPTMVHLVPRPKAGEENSPSFISRTVRVFTAPSSFVFHHANAYEEAGRVVVDSIHYPSLPAVGQEATAAQNVDPDAAFASRLRRVDIDLETDVLKVLTAFDGYLEMPAVAPNAFSRRHRYVFGYHSIFEDPQIALIKVDMERRREADVWRPGPCSFALEPKFVPRSGEAEDSGWIVTQLLDSEKMKSKVVILDAGNLAQGPVAVLTLRQPLPNMVHSCWSPVYYGA